ncbi:MAG TPA: hypothetical protein DDX98_08395 [Bacteroidales bacterium]|jgi:hypothetical protein|nr:hypothetical protein [Bacteroidales bacterium]
MNKNYKPMKPISLIIGIFACIAVFSQPVLTHNNHALKTGVNNPMTYCTYVEAGESGSNKFWDFSELHAIKEFTGHISNADNAEFPLANTELEEFGVRFFYDISESGIEHYGYLSRDGRTKIIYDNPFVKIRFPFAFNERSTSTFDGTYYVRDKELGNIEGNGEVFADAWGTIILPGGVAYENTLRVKSQKSYTIHFENASQHVEMVTYRWYNSAHRYPLLVLIQTTTSSKNNEPTIGMQAAYNVNAVKSSITSVDETNQMIDFDLYPNPASDAFFLELDSEEQGRVLISITDLSGRVLVGPLAPNIVGGKNTIDLSDELSPIKEGIYIIRLETDGKIATKEFSIVR